MSLTTLGQLNSKKSLTVFDRFVVDYNLPKHQGVVAEGGLSTISAASVSSTSTFIVSSSDGTWVGTNHKVASPSKKPGWLARQWDKIFLRQLAPVNTPAPLSVAAVFSLVLGNQGEIQLFEDREAKLEQMLASARLAGQTSMVQALEKERDIRKFENALFAKGRKRVVTEAQLLSFVANCERGLCLDWIANFARPIPEDVLAEKLACDKDKLFDNYVVLHYDPDNKGTSQEDRDKEVERVKDPILFGVLQGSRKLYFVGDWQDEFCDLTLQELVDQLGVPLEMT